MFFRRALLTLSFLTVLMPSVLALPASAANVQFHCWCRDTTTRTCNHHLIDSGVADTNESWAGAGLTVGLVPGVGGTLQAGVLLAATFEELLARPGLRDRLSSVADQCPARCAADGGKTAIHFETTYRVDICRECNPSATSSCSEEQSGRLAFGAEATKAAIAQCEDRQAETSLLPIHLAIPIGGISQVNGLPDYISVAYRYMVTIVLVVAIVMVVYGGFRYLVGASMGDIHAGKKIIQDAIVGMLLVLGAYTILSTINPATTILSFTSPEAINCQDLAIPDVVKNARCSGDSECGSGKRCVLAKNVIVSGGSIAEGAAAGFNSSAASQFVGDGSGDTAFSRAVQSGDFVMAYYLFGTRNINTVLGAASQLVPASVRVCSTGEQGSPCTSVAATRVGGEEIGGVSGSGSCRSGLVCVESWGMCWPGSGNAPGMPCDNNGQCSNNRCISVEGTDYKVCEIAVQNGTPCAFIPGSLTTFPIQCNESILRSGLEFTCAYCPSGAGGVARNWGALAPGEFPGIPTSGQCKPLSVLGTSCAP